jgi:hypothetical protein
VELFRPGQQEVGHFGRCEGGQREESAEYLDPATINSALIRPKNGYKSWAECAHDYFTRMHQVILRRAFPLLRLAQEQHAALTEAALANARSQDAALALAERYGAEQSYLHRIDNDDVAQSLIEVARRENREVHKRSRMSTESSQVETESKSEAGTMRRAGRAAANTVDGAPGAKAARLIEPLPAGSNESAAAAYGYVWKGLV